MSPLKPTSKNNNSLYLEGRKSSAKKHTNSITEYHHQEGRYNEDNLYKHPYVGDKEKKKDSSYMEKYRDNQPYNNYGGVFRRF